MWSRPWRLAASAAGGYLILAVLWHNAANTIGDDHAGIRALAKGACLAAGVALFLFVSTRLSMGSPRVVHGALWSAGGVAGGALGVAFFDVWLTDWGRLCNQCDPASALVGIPVLFGAGGFAAALVMGWLVRLLRT